MTRWRTCIGHFCRTYGLNLCLLVALGCRVDPIRVYRIPKETRTAQHHEHDGQNHPTARPQLKWKTPPGWEEQPPSQFRVASFLAKGPGDQVADISVIPLPGGAGGVLDNVNRWRRQVGLSPIAAEDLDDIAEPTEMAGPPAPLYDLAGANIRILSVMQVRDGTTWFIKMTGPPAWVGAQKPAFREFLKSLEFTATGPPAIVTPRWPAPPEWQAVEPGQFLEAKFVVAGTKATLNISTAPGDGGGVTANVNRWRKQLGLPELAAAEGAAALQSVSTGGGEGQLVELTGPGGAVVGVIVTQPQQTWFFKLSGDPAVVTAQKSVLLEFVRKARF